MRDTRLHRLAIALAAFALAIVVAVLGVALVPTRVTAETRSIIPQWAFTWGLLWFTVLAAVALAGFMLARARERS